MTGWATSPERGRDAKVRTANSREERGRTTIVGLKKKETKRLGKNRGSFRDGNCDFRPGSAIEVPALGATFSWGEGRGAAMRG